MRKFQNVLGTSLTRISSFRWQADPDSCRVIGIDTEIARPKARERLCEPVKSLDLKFERRMRLGKNVNMGRTHVVSRDKGGLVERKGNGSVPLD